MHSQMQTPHLRRTGFACNGILALILSRIMGGNGIALALSIASFINSIVTYSSYRLSHMQAGFLTKQIIGYAINSLFIAHCYRTRLLIIDY